MSAQSELDALFAVYEGYLEEYADRVVSNGPFHGLHKFLLGTSTPGDRKADSAFYRAAEQAASALAAAGPEPGGFPPPGWRPTRRKSSAACTRGSSPAPRCPL